MGDNDHRHTLGGKLLHDLQDFTDHFRVQRTGRLVKQHDIRVHGQGAGNSHALLLAAGQLRRVGFGLVGQTHAVQQVQGLLLGFTLRGLFQLHRGQRHVAHDVEVIEQVEVLEHHADILAHFVQIGFLVGQVVAIHNDCAAGDFFQAVQAAQKSRLAAAGGAEDDNDLALIDIRRHIAQDLEVAEVFFQMLNVNFDILLIDAHG